VLHLYLRIDKEKGVNENARKFLKHAYLLFPNPFFLEIPKSILSIKENLGQILNHFIIP
jgi:hypothetical protein